MSWLPDLGLATLVGDIGTQALAVATVLTMAIAIRQQVVTARIRALLDELALERPDPETALLPQNALHLRLDPELAWAQIERQQMGIVVFHVHGARPERAARALRVRMRGEENAYLLGRNRFVAGLWNTSEDDAHLAVGRLGGAMTEAAHNDVLDAGLAMFPEDGTELDQLIEIAANNLRPVDQQPAPKQPGDAPRRVRRALPRFLSCMVAMAPGLFAALGLLAAAHVAFPITFTLTAPDGGIGPLLLRSLLTCAALAVATAAVALLVWNRGAPGEPRSAGAQRMGLALALIVALVSFTLLAWGVLRPDWPQGLNVFTGPVVWYDIVLLLVLLQARFLIRMEVAGLALLVAVGAGLTYGWYASDTMIANLGRLLLAMGLGAIFARNLERLSWVVLLAVAISGIDLWSVFAASGTTNDLSQAPHGSVGAELLSAALLQAPSIGGSPIFYLGTTDLVFSMVFLSFSHFWRLDMARVMVALVLGGTVATIASGFRADGVPVLPFLALAFLLANAGVLWRELVGHRRDDSSGDGAPSASSAADGGGRTPVPAR